MKVWLENFLSIFEAKTPLSPIYLPDADPENSERGGRKMSWREREIAPYPQHMTGILGTIEKYRLKDNCLQIFFKKSEKGGGGRGKGRPPRSPSKSDHDLIDHDHD